MVVFETRVASKWVDYNGHMNDAEYARVFSLAVDALMEKVGLDTTGRARHRYTLYTLETHLCYRREAHEDQPLKVAMNLVERDSKRLHVFFRMEDEEDNLLASSEQMLMGIDLDSGRPAGFPAPVDEAIAALPRMPFSAHPEPVSRTIAIRR